MNDWSQDCEDLFAAGRMVDEPSAEDRERVALRITAQVATGAAVVSLTAAAGTAGTTAATVSKVGTGLSLAKVMVSLAIGATAVGVATTAVVKSARPAVDVTQVQVPAQTRSPTPSSMAIPPVEDVPSPAVQQAPAAPVPSLAPAPASTTVRKIVSERATPVPAIAPASSAPTAGPTAEPSAPAIGEDTASEARLVRSIDDAIRRHDVSAAERLLDEHDATFPHGHFGEECAAARVLARCDATPTDDARHAACTFFAQHPRSPMRARIEEACVPRCDLSR